MHIPQKIGQALHGLCLVVVESSAETGRITWLTLFGCFICLPMFACIYGRWNWELVICHLFCPVGSMENSLKTCFLLSHLAPSTIFLFLAHCNLLSAKETIWLLRENIVQLQATKQTYTPVINFIRNGCPLCLLLDPNMVKKVNITFFKIIFSKKIE
jgi:hypothetical protein